MDRRSLIILKRGLRNAFAFALVLCALGLPSFSPATAGVGATTGVWGSAGSGSTGFLPAGHWVASPVQGLTQVFPQSDGTTDPNAREHWAYWDGTNDVPYDLAIGVSFGAYPYVCTLTAGPPGMVVEHSTYTSFQDPDYCRVLWHPQGNIVSNWTGTVSVLVTDQQHNSITLSWTLSTDDTTTHFVFVSTTGSGSSCTYSVPCTFTTAFGSTFAATSFPDAICYAFGGSYTGSTNLPFYTDTDTGTNGFETDSASKPNAIIGIPGQTVTLDATGGPILIQLSHANDWYMENITANGYDASAIARLIFLSSSRDTFDQVSWTNSGYGTGTSANMSMFVSGASQNPRSNLFITDSSESNRESGAVGNNYGFLDLYSYAANLVQRSIENSPSASLDAVFYYKSDITNSEMRENYANVAGSTHGFDYGQAQDSGVGNDQTDYNLGINVKQIWVNQAGTLYTWLNTAVIRNTVISGAGQGLRVGSSNSNLGGPWINAPTSVSGGSLTVGTEYLYNITSEGVTGESTATLGSIGNTNQGKVAGGPNQVNVTIASGDGSAALTWDQEPGATGYKIYCEPLGGGGEQLLTTIASGSTTSYTDTNCSTTATSPPSSSTAISNQRDDFYANCISSTFTPQLSTSGFIVTSGAGIAANVVDSSGTNTIIEANGQLNPAYSGYSSIIGQAGYQIQ